MSFIPSCLTPGDTHGLDADDLTSGLLDLSEASQEVPVTGLGDRGVGREDGHAVHGGGRVGLGGQMAANDLVLLKTTWRLQLVLSSSILSQHSSMHADEDGGW